MVLRKPHPCGSHAWSIVRLGADIGLSCAGCSRRVLLERADLERRLISLERPGSPEPAPTNARVGEA